MNRNSSEPVDGQDAFAEAPGHLMNLPEDRDLTFAEAEADLPDGPLIHTFTEIAGVFAGEDRPRHEVLALLREAAVIRRSGDLARAMGHGLAVLHARDEHAGVTWIEPERRDRLHLAVGAYAEYLAGLASESEARAAAAALGPAELADYAEITADLKARFGRDAP
jgi:hypothetical protein